MANNEIFGTSGDDRLVATSDSNTLYGLDGADRLIGSEGDEVLIGGAGWDTLLGRAGNDILQGGTGKDLLKGEEGADVFLYEPGDLDGTQDSIYGFSFAEGDTIDLSAIVAAEGWTQAEALAALIFTDTSRGVDLDIVTSAGTLAIANIRDLSAADFAANMDAIVLSGAPAADTADDDGNLALAAPDLAIGPEDDVTAVAFTVTGLDAGSTAVITVSDGTSAIVSGTISADGTVTLDLSYLADGPLTTEITASASGQEPVTLSGPSLDKAITDTTADADGNLALVAPDTSIDASEVSAVVFTVTGLDDDATAVITVSDGSTTVTSDVITANGSFTLDLGSLAGDTLTTTITATDGSLNTATASGPNLVLTRTAPPEGAIYGTEGDDQIVDGDADSTIFGLGGNDRLVGNGGADMLIGGEGNDTLLGRAGNDILHGGTGRDLLKGRAGADVHLFEPGDLDGARDRIFTFSLAEGDTIDLSAIVAAEGWTQAQAEAALILTDTGTGVELDIVTSAGRIAVAEIRDLSAADFAANMDAFILEGSEDTTPPPPDTADDDGNLALSAPDTAIDIDQDDVTAVKFTVSGLDAGSTAVITVSDGSGSVTSGAIGADGTVTLNLSSLADGPLTTSLTASASGAEDVTVSGPGLTLDTTPSGGGGTGGGGTGDVLSFDGTGQAVVANLATGTYAYAATVMPIGDSLTVGWIDGTEPLATREGYRMDFFEDVISAGGWIDYVGAASNGPAEMMDTDHAGVGGIALWQVTSNDDSVAGPADVSNAAATYTPDIALMMLGTNDMGANFPNNLGAAMRNMTKAVQQFYAEDADGTLVVSTLAPRMDSGRELVFSEYFNEGYSTVGGNLVVGDAGNGTYVAGLKATISGLQGSYSSLLLFNNPHQGTDHFSSDDLHWTQAAYAEYAAALYAFLEDEVGLTGGTLGGTAQSIASGVTDLYGSDAGDRLTGDAGNNTLNGGAGSDLLKGKGGADVFEFDMAALGSFDRIEDFRSGQGDMIDISDISAGLGLSANQARSALSLEDSSAGVKVLFDAGSTTYHLATLDGLDTGDVSIAGDFILTGGTS